MYLSRVQINTNNRLMMKELSHIGAVHHWVEQSFPDEFQRKERTRKLWRIDELNGKRYLLIVSEDKPKIEKLERYGVEGTAETKDYDKFLELIKNGDQRAFRVTLNPVVSIPNKNSKRGRVVPLMGIEEQMNFLKDRALKNGFSLEDNAYTIVEKGSSILKKKGDRDIRLVRATYQGVLTVIDADQFRKTLTQGFGKKKAYGFGMMTII